MRLLFAVARWLENDARRRLAFTIRNRKEAEEIEAHPYVVTWCRLCTESTKMQLRLIRRLRAFIEGDTR